jgi:hypothetical protein
LANGQKKITREIARKELRRRAEVKLFHRGNADDPEFKAQNAFINDKSHLKAGICTRRAGKSFGCGKILFSKALKHKESVQVYIAKTRDSAKRIMVPVMRDINRRYKCDARINKSELSYELPNGSIIYLLGMDSDDKQKDKILGQSFLTVIIDEAAFFGTDLHSLIYEHLLPCISDYGDDGQIILISTPSDIVRGLYYDVTTGAEKGWSVHRWSTFDNPYQAKQFRKQIELLKANKPGIEITPLYKRMYLAQWYIDVDNLVYKFDRAADVVKLDQSYFKDDRWTNVLSIDLGYNDDSAFTVLAYHPNDPNLYIRFCYKKPKMIVQDVAEKIKEIAKKFPINHMVIDPASKQVVMELINRYDLPLNPAEKTDKHKHIEIMNSDLICNRIKVLSGTGDPLIEEWTTLVWDGDKKLKGKYEEHPACPNHLADTVLYGWRYCYPYLWRPEEEEKTVDDEMEEYWEKEANEGYDDIDNYLNQEDEEFLEYGEFRVYKGFIRDSKRSRCYLHKSQWSRGSFYVRLSHYRRAVGCDRIARRERCYGKNRRVGHEQNR